MKDLINRDKANILKEVKLICKWILLNKDSLTQRDRDRLHDALQEADILVLRIWK